MHQFDSEFLLGLLFAVAVAIALIALPCAIVITLALNRMFRSWVGRSMRATGGAAVHPELHQPLPHGPQGTLEIEPTAAPPERAKAARAAPLLAEARRQARRLAALYATGASAYPLFLAAAFIVAIDFSSKRNVILVFALLAWSDLIPHLEGRQAL
jgi:hypothetical protein